MTIDEEKLLLLFGKVHGPITGSCYAEIVYNEDHNPSGVNVMKEGNLCWNTSIVDLLFEYITENIQKGILP